MLVERGDNPPNITGSLESLNIKEFCSCQSISKTLLVWLVVGTLFATIFLILKKDYDEYVASDNHTCVYAYRNADGRISVLRVRTIIITGATLIPKTGMSSPIIVYRSKRISSARLKDGLSLASKP